MNATFVFDGSKVKKDLAVLLAWIETEIHTRERELLKHNLQEGYKTQAAVHLERELEQLRLDQLDATIWLAELDDNLKVRIDTSEMRWLYRYKGHPSIQLSASRRK